MYFLVSKCVSNSPGGKRMIIPRKPAHTKNTNSQITSYVYLYIYICIHMHWLFFTVVVVLSIIIHPSWLVHCSLRIWRQVKTIHLFRYMGASLSNFFVMSAAAEVKTDVETEVKTEVSAAAKEPRRRNDNVILLHLPISCDAPHTTKKDLEMNQGQPPTSLIPGIITLRLDGSNNLYIFLPRIFHQNGKLWGQRVFQMPDSSWCHRQSSEVKVEGPVNDNLSLSERKSKYRSCAIKWKLLNLRLKRINQFDLCVAIWSFCWSSLRERWGYLSSIYKTCRQHKRIYLRIRF